MSIEAVNVYLQNDDLGRSPVAGVVVRVFDATGTSFITQALSDSTGLASFSLTAPASYQLRFFKERFSIGQPQRVSVLEAPVLPDTNNFNAVGHVYAPPEAVHPRLCRCSGFFKRPDNSPAVGHDAHFIAKFDPLLFEGSAMLTERLQQRTDDAGFMQIDLVRFGQYEVTLEGFEDSLRVITVPDAPSVNLPDLLFPVVEGISFSPAGPYSVLVGAEHQVTITPVVTTSDGRVLPGTAIRDVRWRSSDANVLAVLPTATTLVLRGIGAGSAQLIAERTDRTIVRIPNTPIQGVPVDVIVTQP